MSDIDKVAVEEIELILEAYRTENAALKDWQQRAVVYIKEDAEELCFHHDHDLADPPVAAATNACSIDSSRKRRRQSNASL